MSEERKIKKISYNGLLREAAFIIWRFRMIMALILVVPVTLLNTMLDSVLHSSDNVITTANLGRLLNWRTSLILLYFTLTVLLYIATEILAQIGLCDDILSDRKPKVSKELKKSISVIRLFLDPFGILMIVFVLVAVPLASVGFSVSITEDFYIPEFIMSVILAKPLTAVMYYAVIIVFAFLSAIYCFSFHAILIDRKKPLDAMRLSRRLVRDNFKSLASTMLKVLAVTALINIIFFMLLDTLPAIFLEEMAEELPKNHIALIESDYKLKQEVSETDAAVIIYRCLSALYVLLGTYLRYLVYVLCSGAFMFHLTGLYKRYTGVLQAEYHPQISIGKHIRNSVVFIGIIVAIIVVCLVVGVSFDLAAIFAPQEKVRIIAHRTGGNLASENSLEGIDASVERGLYGSETDIQRTKDGEYVINHDNTFKRLTGVNKKPSEMTLAEIKELEITDTTGSGKKLPVPTLDELLDRGKGRIKLFLELKGDTADRRMVDDVVEDVKEKDMVEDVVLISLKYDIIDYAEKTYPEFDTGVLIFGVIGDVSLLNCDMIIMEEEMSTNLRLREIHDKGKSTGVWTVDSEESLHKFLSEDSGSVITDSIELALDTQRKLDDRNDLQKMRDFMDIWL